MCTQVRQPIRLLCNQNFQKYDGTIAGHLSMKISWPTKYLLQRDALLEATLSSRFYRRSPLLQSRLENLYKITTNAYTIRKRSLILKEIEMVELFYIEACSPATLGSILYINTHNDNEQYRKTKGRSTKTQSTNEVRKIFLEPMMTLKLNTLQFFHKP